MELDAKRLTVAVAIVTAVLWVVCSAVVSIAPGPAMDMTGHMVHADMGELSWSLTWSGFVVGLISWTFAAAIPAWFIALAYNRLGRSKAS